MNFSTWIAAVITGIFTIGVLVGVFLLFPAFLRSTIAIDSGLAKDWRDRVLLKYQDLSASAGIFTVSGTFAWVFAWFKLLLDPMFEELPEFFAEMPSFSTALDIGCGYGITGCALLEWFPDLKLFGIDPNAKRVRAAGVVFGNRGMALQGLAPDFERPELPDRVDLVILLDVIHFMTAPKQELTLRRIRAKLKDDGQLVIRAIIPPVDNGGSWAWKIAQVSRFITGGYACHHSIDQMRQIMERANFAVEKTGISGGNPELCWFIARAGRNGAEQTAAAPAELERGR